MTAYLVTVTIKGYSMFRLDADDITSAKEKAIEMMHEGSWDPVKEDHQYEFLDIEPA
jgi:hypothetical protein